MITIPCIELSFGRAQLITNRNHFSKLFGARLCLMCGRSLIVSDLPKGLELALWATCSLAELRKFVAKWIAQSNIEWIFVS